MILLSSNITLLRHLTWSKKHELYWSRSGADLEKKEQRKTIGSCWGGRVGRRGNPHINANGIQQKFNKNTSYVYSRLEICISDLLTLKLNVSVITILDEIKEFTGQSHISTDRNSLKSSVIIHSCAHMLHSKVQTFIRNHTFTMWTSELVNNVDK